MRQTQDLNVAKISRLVSPADLKRELPLETSAADTVVAARAAVTEIIQGDDPRLLVIVGPCSVHDEAAAIEYAERLAELAHSVRDELYIVMRVYFEKPRTTVGWRGMIVDPQLDGSYDLGAGLHAARRILLSITALGLPCGTEMLDPIVPQYIADVVSWTAVGARTTESQTHREMASGLSMPVGFKNTTDGNLQVAIEATISARGPHSFLGVDQDGRIATVTTSGNAAVHVILRGGRGGSNYDAASVASAAATLQEAGLSPMSMVDCSHANSGKKHQNQLRAWDSVLEQRRAGGSPICGAMLESNLIEGRQEPTAGLENLVYGKSITDECMSWETTELMLRGARSASKAPLATR
jgi:3-deoxy-7-phosphoheptulonate synthase